MKEATKLSVVNKTKGKLPRSFSLTEKSGELLLAPSLIKKEAPRFEMNVADFTLYLIIHGMLHLKGYEHGSTMEDKEEKWKKYFHIS